MHGLISKSNPSSQTWTQMSVGIWLAVSQLVHMRLEGLRVSCPPSFSCLLRWRLLAKLVWWSGSQLSSFWATWKIPILLIQLCDIFFVSFYETSSCYTALTSLKLSRSVCLCLSWVLWLKTCTNTGGREMLLVGNMLLLMVFLCCFCFSRQGFSVYPWLSWNSLCRPGWPRTQKSTCLCLPSAGIKGLRHAQLMFSLTYTSDGEKGTGKTLSLCHAVHFCARHDWLILHIPDGKDCLLCQAVTLLWAALWLLRRQWPYYTTLAGLNSWAETHPLLPLPRKGQLQTYNTLVLGLCQLLFCVRSVHRSAPLLDTSELFGTDLSPHALHISSFVQSLNIHFFFLRFIFIYMSTL
jgi:hypothetical protein